MLSSVKIESLTSEISDEVSLLYQETFGFSLKGGSDIDSERKAANYHIVKIRYIVFLSEIFPSLG